MTDQNRKTLRSFYCRDYLWELFEQMTHDLGCSMDYLINESMRLYARSRDYVPNEDPGQNFGNQQQQQQGFGGGQQSNGFGAPPQPSFNSGQNQFGAPMEHRTFDRIPPVQNQGMGGGNPPGGGVGFGNQMNPPPPPPPGGGGMNPGFGQQPMGGGMNQGGGFGQPQQQPMGGGVQSGSFGAAPAGQQPLYLIFNNNRYVVDKEKFVIGRGSQQTDLTIRDGNISRKHCAVIFRNGAYYIKDLDSTNGVEFRGSRIESKKVDEGDVFYLCDYELRFTYRA